MSGLCRCVVRCKMIGLPTRTGKRIARSRCGVATYIPVEELGARLAEISDYQERPVITVCRTDRKSAQAAQILAKNGSADVHVARMGMTAWIEQGYEIEH